MTATATDYFLLAAVQFRLRDGTGSAETLYFTNRQVKTLTLAGAAITAWPVLEQISGFGAVMDEVLPKFESGQIVLNNTPGRFGKDRKVADYLQRYTPINQSFTLYLKAMAPESTAAVAIVAGDKIYSGTIDSLGFDAQGLTLKTVTAPLPDRPACMMISEEITEFADAPEYSIGQYLPIPFGYPAYVPMQLVSTGNANSFTYAHTCAVSGKDAGGAFYLTAPDHLGQWRILYADSRNGNDGADASSAVDPETYAELIYAIDLTTGSALQSAQAVAGFQLRLQGNDDTSDVDSMLVVNLYTVANGYPEQIIANGVFNLNDVEAANTAGATIYVNVMFPQPVVVDDYAYDYAVGVSWGGYTTNDPTWRQTTDSVNQWSRDNADESGGFAFVKVSSAANPGYCIPISLAWDGATSQTAANTAGYKAGYSTITLDVQSRGTPAAPTVSVENFPFATLAYSFQAHYDFDEQLTNILYEWKYVSGIFGSAQLDWNWSVSGPSDYYDTYFPDDVVGSLLTGYLQRSPSGYIPGYVTLEQLVNQVCFEMASRVGAENDGSLFLWPWGPHYTVAANIHPDDISFEGWREDDLSSVTNNISFKYGVNPLGIVQTALTGSSKPASNQKNYNQNTDAVAAEILTASTALYGLRELEEVETFFISDSVTAETFAKFLACTRSHPWKFCTIALPYHKYSAVKLLDVVTFSTPAAPAFYGAWAEDAGLYGGTENGTCDAKEGHDWTRAETYRAIVEGRWLDVKDDAAPVLRLQLRILDNLNDPT